MGKLSRKSLSIAVALLTLAAGGARGQWKIVARHLAVLQPHTDGAMSFHNGVVWLASDYKLFRSTDSGTSWTAKSLPADMPMDVQFYDSVNGIVTGDGDGFGWLTSDGGTNWLPLFSLSMAPSVSVCFLNNDSSFAIAMADGFGGITTNGGQTWNCIPDTSGEFEFVCVRYHAGTIYEYGAEYSQAQGFIFTSTDYGATWVQAKTGIDPDSYSFAIDSCGENRIYIVHEDAATPSPDYFAKIFLTTDGGDSWNTVADFPEQFFCGSIAEGGLAVYCQTVNNGVFRSLDRGLTWKTIGGPSAGWDTRLVSAISDNIILAVDGDGSVWRTDNSGGDSIRFSSSPSSALSVSTESLFDQDTIVCDSLALPVFFNKSGCTPPSVLNYLIIGPDSLCYSTSNLSEDSILVTLSSRKTGGKQGKLILLLDNGSLDTVTLGGYVMPDSLFVSTHNLFRSDTIFCDSLTCSVAFNKRGCFPPSVSAWSITGDDSTDFRASNLTNDSIQVTLRPLMQGLQNAQLVLELDDGSSDTVQLEGFVNRPPDILQASPTTAFQSDTITCDSLTHDIAFTRTGCSPPSVTGYSIIGPDSACFEASKLSYDSIIVMLRGIKQGAQQAQLILNLDNGSSDTVALAGYVNLTPAITALSTQDQSTDTLGATIQVPITIQGLTRPEDVNLVLHYDGSVDYLGSFSPAGARLDILGDSSYGRSKLHIGGAVPNQIAGYAEFNVFSDSNEDAHATFDSLDILTATTPCEYSFAASTTSTIYPPKGCAVPILSQLVHLGWEPEFTIVPNPNSGAVWITSSADVGDATIAIYDMLGVKQSEIRSKISAQPLELRLPAPSGVYTIEIRSASGTRTLRVVESR